MKIRHLKDGLIEDVTDSYGRRLVEQGKAVIEPAAKSTPSAKNARKNPSPTAEPRKKETEGQPSGEDA